MGSKNGNTAAVVRALAEPYAKELGLEIWDVKFVKEGAMWYLRIYIDSQEGVTVEDCEALSRAIDAPLDELDPIDQEYIFEVSSPGLERELTRPEHFEVMMGSNVAIKLYKAVDGKKELIGILNGFADGKITIIDEDGKEYSVERKDAVSCHIRLTDEEIFGGIN